MVFRPIDLFIREKCNRALSLSPSLESTRPAQRPGQEYANERIHIYARARNRVRTRMQPKDLYGIYGESQHANEV